MAFYASTGGVSPSLLDLFQVLFYASGTVTLIPIGQDTLDFPSQLLNVVTYKNSARCPKGIVSVSFASERSFQFQEGMKSNSVEPSVAELLPTKKYGKYYTKNNNQNSDMTAWTPAVNEKPLPACHQNTARPWMRFFARLPFSWYFSSLNSSAHLSFSCLLPTPVLALNQFAAYLSATIWPLCNLPTLNSQSALPPNTPALIFSFLANCTSRLSLGPVGGFALQNAYKVFAAFIF